MSIARIRKNDTVVVIHGNDAGRTGVVQKVDRKKGTAIVAGINVHKKTYRRSRGHRAGGPRVPDRPLQADALRRRREEGLARVHRRERRQEGA